MMCTLTWGRMDVAMVCGLDLLGGVTSGNSAFISLGVLVITQGSTETILHLLFILDQR